MVAVLRRPAILFGLSLLLAACQTQPGGFTGSTWPTTASAARTTPQLEDLPPPARPVRLAVYEFPDLTGAYKPNAEFADYSRAVTQGASAVLVDALKKAGRGQWFRVVERDGLENLLKERELIQTTAAALKRDASAQISPLTFADYILEGGIVSFDNEFEAGGVGAAYLGVTGDAEYRKDRVTVALRMTAVRTGEIAHSVTSSRTLYSTSVSAGLSRYVSSDLLNVSGGVTRVDPTQLAVQEAIEAAVLQLIVDGTQTGLWSIPTEVASAAPPSAVAPDDTGPPSPSDDIIPADVIYENVSPETGPRATPAPRSSGASAAPALTAFAPPSASQPGEGDFWLRQLRRH